MSLNKEICKKCWECEGPGWGNLSEAEWNVSGKVSCVVRERQWRKDWKSSRFAPVLQGPATDCLYAAEHIVSDSNEVK